MNEQQMIEAFYGDKTSPAAAEDPPKADDTSTSIADRMYGEKSTPAADANQSAEKPAAEKPVEKTAEAGDFKISVPENVAKLRGESTDRRLFNADFYKSTDGLDATFEGAETPAEHLTAATREIREMALDLRLEPNQFRDVVPLFAQHLKSPPDGKTAAEWRGQAQTELERVYGSKDEAAKAADLARALVQRDPRLAAMLDRSGLGSHPQIVVLLAERARALRQAGDF